MGRENFGFGRVFTIVVLSLRSSGREKDGLHVESGLSLRVEEVAACNYFLVVMGQVAVFKLLAPFVKAAAKCQGQVSLGHDTCFDAC